MPQALAAFALRTMYVTNVPTQQIAELEKANIRSRHRVQQHIEVRKDNIWRIDRCHGLSFPTPFLHLYTGNWRRVRRSRSCNRCEAIFLRIFDRINCFLRLIVCNGSCLCNAAQDPNQMLSRCFQRFAKINTHMHHFAAENSSCNIANCRMTERLGMCQGIDGRVSKQNSGSGRRDKEK